MKLLRWILIIVGVGAWGPVIYLRHVKHVDLSFLQVLPFLTLHVSCMVTLLILRIRSKRKNRT